MKNIKKKLKLLLSKEEGKISKIGMGVVGSILFFNIVNSNLSLNNQLFDITGDPTPQHQHNIIVKVNNTEPSDITFTQQINQSCLIIYEVGAHRGWKDVENALINSDNTYTCSGDSISKTCIAKGVRTSGFCRYPYDWDTGLVKYEWHNNDPNFDCNSQYGTFETQIYTASNNDYNCNSGGPARSNIWKNVI